MCVALNEAKCIVLLTVGTIEVSCDLEVLMLFECVGRFSVVKQELLVSLTN